MTVHAGGRVLSMRPGVSEIHWAARVSRRGPGCGFTLLVSSNGSGLTMEGLL